MSWPSPWAGLANRLARSTDPETSKIAARRVGEFNADHKERILEALTKYEGLNIHEIARMTGIDAHAVGKRMSELEALGDVEVATDPDGKDLTRPGPSGRPARVWQRTVFFIGSDA